MGNDQGRRHSRRKRRTRAKGENKPVDNEMRFIDTDDDYIWENHVIGRLPFKDVEEIEIVFHTDKLWQEDELFEKFHFLNFLIRDGPSEQCQL